jgi:hypothetical protein
MVRESGELIKPVTLGENSDGDAGISFMTRSI